MSTVTTTVTTTGHAGSSTVTTTETAAAANPAVAHVKAMIGSWAAGNLIADKNKYFADCLEVDAGPGNAPGFGKYTMATFDTWIGEDGAAQYGFNDMNWDFYPTPFGAIGEWSVSSLTVLATGESTGAMNGVNRFYLSDGKINKVIIDNSRVGELEALTNADVNLCKSMVGSWAAGTLIADKNKYFADSLEVDAGPDGVAPGFGKYTMATFDTWITELTNYEFNDMNWEFLPAPYGCIAEWTVSSNTVKSTGKSTGPMLGINRFIVTGGKITKVTISNSEIHQVASACASA